MKFYKDLLNLQRFAEDVGDGAGESGNSDESNANDTDNNTENSTDDTKPFKSFDTEDDLNSWFDSNYDKRFEKSAEKLRAKWDADQQQQKSYDEMSDTEKQAYDLDQRSKKLDQQAKDLEIKTNRANITTRLANDGLPTELADAFEPALSDTKGLDTLYTVLTKSYRTSVKSGVDKQLASSSNVPGAAGANVTVSAGESFAEQRNKQGQSTSANLWQTK
ncbi:phage capsid protein [Levilactobacillus brevis]|uniref:capsid assembly scaffolding protein Gp46 family protein n=1 Tax=Levilactobacillus brevis TaxID=1580 RepID=UPI000A20B485|nr:DUF4355 domain-containing protein [Levilactobacillus brevis]ARN92891.1 phage capsid protein [Levilactobacillus brevis]ARN95535.1 phage capsid protein [Levilactobacillus brevis]MBS0978679.1 DUF4355 domain-containing protein [Levilactobacillus brevis]